MCPLLFIPFATAFESTTEIRGTSPLTAANVIFKPYSIDHVTSAGNIKTEFFTGSIAGNTKVDIIKPVFTIVNTEQISSNATSIIYRIDAEAVSPLTFYTKTPAWGISHQITNRDQWCDYIHYILVSTPSINPTWTWSKKITDGPFVGQIIDSTNDLDRETEYNHVVFPYSTMVSTVSTIPVDDFQNLVMNIGYIPPRPVTFRGIANMSVSILFEVTSWQLTGVYATSDCESLPLGSYNSAYQTLGTEQKTLEPYTATDLQDVSRQFLTETERTYVPEDFGWKVAGQTREMVEQHGITEGPTRGGNVLWANGNQLSRANVNSKINLGYHLRPQIITNTQLLEGTKYRLDFQNGLVERLDAESTIQITRNLGTRVENNVIQQEWKTTFSYYVTVTPTNLATSDIIGMSCQEQADLVIHAANGNMDNTSLGSFAPDNIFTNTWVWIGVGIIIIITFLTVVYKTRQRVMVSS
jgi:hypothetical protein